MKTLTEFDGFRLKTALETKKQLVTAGKTPEELPAALGEALKLEGDKLTLIMNALEVAADRTESLKRVVVLTLAEGEKAPNGAVEKDGKAFVVEFFYTAQPKRESRGGRDGDRKGGRGGRDGKGKGRGGRGGRGGGRDGEKREAGAGPGTGGGEKRDGGGRPPRGPRPPRAPQAAGGPPNVKPNAVPSTPKAESKPETKSE